MGLAIVCLGLLIGGALCREDDVVLESVQTRLSMSPLMILRTEIQIRMRALPDAHEDAEYYYMLLSHGMDKQLSYAAVVAGGAVLPSERIEAEGHAIHRYKLDKPLRPGEAVDLTVKMATGKGSYPWPPKTRQDAPQRYKIEHPAVLFSPYRVVEQTTSITIACQSIESFSQSADLLAHQVGTLIRFGPFKDTREYSQRGFYVHFVNNHPRPVVTSCERKVVLSHWAGTTVEEAYEILNAAPSLAHEFSRIDQLGMATRLNRGFPLTHLFLDIPKEARFVTYRDEVGNVSTSRYQIEGGVGKLALGTRFPLYGGWRSRMEVSYTVPSDLNISRVGGMHAFSGPVASFFDDILIQNLTFRLVLPEGARIVEIKSPLAGQTSTARCRSYLDTVGRPVVLLHGQNMLQEQSGRIEVRYEYSSLEMLRKPLLLITAVFGLLSAHIVHRRLSHAV